MADKEDWENRGEKVYRNAGFEGEGFMHLCTVDQLVHVVTSYYVGRDDLVLLWVDPEKLRAELKYEDSHGNGELFPHLYGGLNLDAVIEAKPFSAI